MSRFEIAVAWILFLTWVLSIASLLIWLEIKIKAKVHNAKPIKPTIEIYGKNYKRVHKNKFDKVV